MVAKVNDDSFVESVTANKTAALLSRYKKSPVDEEAVRALDEVTLMTPESIRLNSFMCEPLVDMSDEHLRGLYKKVCALR